MKAVIDLGSELLLDLSELSDPYVRLLAAALGQTLAVGSPWVALDKQSAARCGLSPANARCAGRDVAMSHGRAYKGSRRRIR
jgi:hypothetical protein